MFVKICRKVSTAFRSVVEGAIHAELPTKADAASSLNIATNTNGVTSRVGHVAPAATSATLDMSDDEEEGTQVDPIIREKQKALIDALPLEQYTISDPTLSTQPTNADDEAWREAERQIRESGATTVSIKSLKKRKAVTDEDVDADGNGDVNVNGGAGDGEGSKHKKKKSKDREGRKDAGKERDGGKKKSKKGEKVRK